MTLPRSLQALQRQPTTHRGIMIGIEGGANTGKTEFCWSAPGPAIHDALDPGFRSALDSKAPPVTRTLIENENLVIRPVQVPINNDGTSQAEALKMWQTFISQHYLIGLSNPDVRTYILDGDTQSWDLQFLAEFGRTNNIRQLNRGPLKATKRAMVSKAYYSGKVVITTNMVRKQYETILDAGGNPIPDPQTPGEFKREWNGEFQRAGFDEYEYCYEIQLRSLYDRDAKQWGVMFLMCKADRSLEGEVLWGEACNLQNVLLSAYPTIGLEEWGYTPEQLKRTGFA